MKDIDRGWKRIVKQMKEVDQLCVKVGVLSDAGSEKDGTNLADVATYNEFGTDKIPPRPFMKQAYEDNENGINFAVMSLKEEIMIGAQTVTGALKKLGVWFKGRIQATITDGDFAENAPSTIEKKGSSKPLIDTGRLRQSINFELEKGGAK